jgi:Xaa-Pro aminopeptidase
MSLNQAGCRSRRERLLAAAETDFIVISNPRHIFYFTGYFASPLTLGGWGNNHLILDGDRSTLVIHNFFGPNPENVFVDSFASWTWYDGANAGTMMFPDGVKELNKRLGNAAGKRVGVEIGWFPLGASVGETLDITPTILAMRRRKDPDELALIREAISAIEAGHRAAREAIKPGLSELAVYNAVHTAIVAAAGHAVLPLGDFVGSRRTDEVGGLASRHVLQAGELMILDIYPIVNGYRADFTATVSTDGHLTDQQKVLETALHEAQARGEALLKPGTPAREVYQAVRGGLAEYGLAENFTHHAGHGLGLGHPEAPFFVPGSDETVQVGDVVTLEPGAYGDGFGARIEHNYLITNDGYERLTNQKTSFV